MESLPRVSHALPLTLQLLFLAPMAALSIGFFGLHRRAPRWTPAPILASCGVVAACAVWLLSRVAFAGYGLDYPVWTWMIAGDWGLSFGLRLDGLSASVLGMVAVVGGLIHVYAWSYMSHDEGSSRFFLAFHLFFLSMIGLVLSNNYVQLYLFWELTGLCSYLLIGHWRDKASARRAAFQAFMTNRVGDAGFMLAALIMAALFHDTRFVTMFPQIALREPALVALIGVLLFWAACGKSAQFPLYFWLPDAMEGPTPVSALMHAATMVTAGVFLLARSWPLLAAVAGLPQVIAAVGAFTAIFAAVIACFKTDLKRILAYSTVSHLGIMVFAVGLGQPATAVFHLITHGFFKAVLFLCAGNIAHALHQPSAELSQVGGLRKAMPATFAAFSIAALSSAGVWPFAGFYSKDAMLDAALAAGGWRGAAGIAIGALSAFYMFRMLILTFFGPAKDQAGPKKFHEAEPSLAVPVLFLALGALGVGWIHERFSEVLASGWAGRIGPAREAFVALEPLPHLSGRVATFGLLSAVAGAAVAAYLSLGLPEWEWTWRKRRPGIVAALESDFGWKPAVGLMARGVQGFAARLVGPWDKKVVDGLLEGTADVARAFGAGASRLSTGSLNDYIWWMAAAAAALLAGAMRAGAAR
jgi:NADH-quinone oxidoreductase subunit L